MGNLAEILGGAKPPQESKFSFTRLDAGRHQGKTLELVEGKIKKTYANPAGTWTASIEEVESLDQLADKLKEWPTGQVLATGKPLKDITGKIRRSKETLNFFGWGVLPLDADEIGEIAKLNKREPFTDLSSVVDAVRTIHPALEKVGFVATSSSSSFVNGGGLKGVHLYALTDDTSKTPIVLERLHHGAIVEGLGRPYVSAIGALLDRSIVDMALKTPCQPIFEGPPLVIGEITLDREVEVFHGETLNSNEIIIEEDITNQATDIKKQWREDLKDQMIEQRDKWIEARVSEGMGRDEAKSTAQATIDEKKIHLPMSLPIHLDSGEIATVEALLNDPDKYEGQDCHDPLDPDYGSGKALLYLKGATPTIHSFAHGATTYELPSIEMRFLSELERADEDQRVDVLEAWAPDLSALSKAKKEVLVARVKEKKLMAMGVVRAVLQTGKTTVEDAKTSEVDVALDFVKKYDGKLRYDHPAKSWYGWNGFHWERDEMGRVTELFMRLVMEHADGEDTMLKRSFIMGGQQLAGVQNGVATNGGEWDQETSFLATPAGSVDLRTSEMTEAKPEDMMTKVTEVSPEPGEPTQWLKFLKEVTMGEEGMIEYLQLLLGYAITGEISEEAFFVWVGPGGNGKGVALDVLAGVLGNGFFRKASSDTFVAKEHGHPTDLHFLKGARLVVASETDEGKRWDEARAKDLTAPDGGMISSRGMNEDFSSWKAQHTIILTTNYVPKLKNEKDRAMERRLHIIPFKFKPLKPDRSLKQRLLKDEGSKILSWLIDGARKWYSINATGSSIAKPPMVVEASGNYFESQDVMGEFFVEVVADELNTNDPVTARDLYAKWSGWMRERGEDVGTQNAFGARLNRRFGVAEFGKPTTEEALLIKGRPRLNGRKGVAYSGLKNAVDVAVAERGEVAGMETAIVIDDGFGGF